MRRQTRQEAANLVANRRSSCGPTLACAAFFVATLKRHWLLLSSRCPRRQGAQASGAVVDYNGASLKLEPALLSAQPNQGAWPLARSLLEDRQNQLDREGVLSVYGEQYS